MHVVFDRTIPVAGIGLVPWGRLGPERWLTNYEIASLYGWDIALSDAPSVHALADVDPDVNLTQLSTQCLLENRQFQTILQTELPHHNMLTYKPVKAPAALRNLSFLAFDQKLASRLENKAQFRTLMQDLDVPFPAFKIYERAMLEGFTAKDILIGRDEVILQDDTLSGGRGTFVVHDDNSLQAALEAIGRMGGGSHVVVSERIVGAFERSVQAVVTRRGVFVGPLQKQIIGHPLLSNLAVADGDRFCGAEISARDRYAASYDDIRAYALKIGERIQAMGYRGIFGLDCLVSESGQIYVLEINPRITGATPLLTMLHREGEDIPFYLLHILELLDAPYEIPDAAVNPEPSEGSLLVLHSLAQATMRIVSSPRSGLYDANSSAFLEEQLRLDAVTDVNQVLLQQYTPPHMTIKPGGRLMTAFTKRAVLTGDDALAADISDFATSILDKIKLEKA